jgi:ring-1,2-phenylacetyl-CoA epoxidase subunit PaaE
MFVDELLALKNRYLGRLTLAFVMSREPQDVELFNGRIDGQRLRELARTEFDPRTIDEFFICGPGSMVKELAATLKELGAAGKIHVERFAVDTQAARAAAAQVDAAAAYEGCEVNITMDGRRRSFRMTPDRTILDAGEAAGLLLPYSCRAGVCSTCRARITSGTAVMERNQALEDWEVQGGFILCCQARPTSQRLDLSYDEK